MVTTPHYGRIMLVALDCFFFKLLDLNNKQPSCGSIYQKESHQPLEYTSTSVGGWKILEENKRLTQVILERKDFLSLMENSAA